MKRILGAILALSLVAIGCKTMPDSRPASRPTWEAATVTTTTTTRTIATNAFGSKYVYAGLPVMLESGDFITLTNKGFLVGYDDSKRIARWVAFSLHKIAEPGERIPASKISETWRTDNRTKSKVKTADYTRSGYSRGHLAQKASIDTRYGSEAQKETFLIPNAVPQLQKLNNEGWGNLEDDEDLFYSNKYGRVWVICGPVLKGSTKTIGTSRVPVPTGFYRIQVFEIDGKTEVQAFMVKHEATAVARLASVDEIETLTGIDFLAGLPDGLEAALEKSPRAERLPKQ